MCRAGRAGGGAGVNRGHENGETSVTANCCRYHCVGPGLLSVKYQFLKSGLPSASGVASVAIRNLPPLSREEVIRWTAWLRELRHQTGRPFRVKKLKQG